MALKVVGCICIMHQRCAHLILLCEALKWLVTPTWQVHEHFAHSKLSLEQHDLGMLSLAQGAMRLSGQ